jgi:hypothetical protein
VLNTRGPTCKERQECRFEVLVQNLAQNCNSQALRLSAPSANSVSRGQVYFTASLVEEVLPSAKAIRTIALGPLRPPRIPNQAVTHHEVEAGKEKPCDASREEDVADAIDHLVEREPCIGQNGVSQGDGDLNSQTMYPRLWYKCASDVIWEGGGYHFATRLALLLALLGKHKTVSPVLHVSNI